MTGVDIMELDSEYNSFRLTETGRAHARARLGPLKVLPCRRERTARHAPPVAPPGEPARGFTAETVAAACAELA